MSLDLGMGRLGPDYGFEITADHIGLKLIDFVHGPTRPTSGIVPPTSLACV